MVSAQTAGIMGPLLVAGLSAEAVLQRLEVGLDATCKYTMLRLFEMI